jgi:hypothetical protein
LAALRRFVSQALRARALAASELIALAATLAAFERWRAVIAAARALPASLPILARSAALRLATLAAAARFIASDRSSGVIADQRARDATLAALLRLAACLRAVRALFGGCFAIVWLIAVSANPL